MNSKTLITAGTTVIWMLGSAQACSSKEPDGSSSSPMGGASGDGDGDGDQNGDGDGDDMPGTGGTSTGGTTSTGGVTQVGPCDLDGAEVYDLPYDIDEHFYYVNEIPEGVSSALVVAGASCDDSGESAGGAGGGGAGGASNGGESCYVFDYIPDADDDDETAPSWGGIIVQSNEMDDGLGDTGEGICIEPGATVISFEAKADNDITDVKFGAIRPGPGSTEHWIRLTSEWAEYTISIPPGEPYNSSANSGGVWNGFSAVLEPDNQDAEPLPDVTRISIRNVVWED